MIGMRSLGVGGGRMLHIRRWRHAASWRAGTLAAALCFLVATAQSKINVRLLRGAAGVARRTLKCRRG